MGSLKSLFLLVKRSLIIGFLSASFSYGFEKGVCHSFLDVSAPYSFKLSDAEKVFTQAYGKPSQVLRMTRAEYRKAVEKDLILPNSILVLDAMDLELDLPVVAGVIISNPLTIPGTHIQDLCEKMGIPLVYVPGAYNDERLIDLAQNKNSQVVLDTRKDSLLIKVGFPLEEVEKATPVFPQALLQETGPLVVFSSSTTQWPREVVGDKFFPLARLKKEGYKEMPDMAALTAYFFESFLENFEFEGRTLKVIFEETKRDLAQQNDLVDIKKILEQVVESVYQSTSVGDQGHHLLNEVLDQIKKAMPIFDETSLSVRSNNDIEDKIAAGAYASAKTVDASKEELEKAVKKVIASLFSSRAYSIRDAWNLSDEYLRMPLLIHEYIDDEAYNGTAQFSTDKEGHLIVSIQLVKGSESKATNPNSASEVIEQLYRYEKPSFVPLGDDALDEKFAFAMESFLNSLEPHVREHLHEMKMSPLKIDIEFVASLKEAPTANGRRAGKYKFNLLQYKHRYSTDMIYSVLMGEVPSEDLDKPFVVVDGNETLDSIAESLQTVPLDSLRDGFKKIRYALIKIGSEYEIIAWNTSVFHDEIRQKIARKYPNVSWIRSGYIMNPPEHFALIFSKTSEAWTDKPRSWTGWTRDTLFPEEAFKAAFKNAYIRKGRFFEFVSRRPSDMVVIFRSLKKEWTLSMNQIKSWMVSDVPE